MMDYLSCVVKLRPDVTWENNTVNAHSLETIAETYQSSQPFPTQEECDAAWELMQQDILGKKLEAALDAYIDSVAQSKDANGKQRYDNRITACLRAAAPNSPWHADGVAFIEWMDNCYAQAYQLMKDVQNGLAEIPTEEELINSLPEMVWPE